MSGIYGLFGRDGVPAAPQTLAAMRAAMEAWGPDGCGGYQHGAVGLGHLMLHTTPESLHEQVPVAHPHRPDLLITADARIDNRAELCAELGISVQEQHTLGDALLILLAYARWGERCLPRLLGDFAFVIWDGTRQELFCARDPLGCKPLHYYLTPDLFVFASEVRGVLAHPAVPQRLNEPLLALYLQDFSQHAEKRLTFFEGIVKLPSGHLLRVTPGEARLQQYWSVEDVPALRYSSDADYEEHLRHLLHEAVGCRLRSAFPVGAHLSGGLDSSAVAVLAAHGLREQGRDLAAAYSWSPPPAAGATLGDERRRVEQACTIAGITCQYLQWGVDHAVDVYRRDLTVQPRQTLLRELLIQRMAQQAGVRLILSGWGGDEGISFNGRGYLAELLVHGRLRTLRDELWARMPGSGRINNAKSLLATLYGQVFLPIMPDAMLPMLGQQGLLSPADARYINPTFASRSRRDVARLRGPSLRPRPGLRRMQQRLFNYGHLSERCECWAISGAQHSVEYSYPLLDRRIVEFALGIPANQHYRDGERRRIFRRSLRDVLPEAGAGRSYKDEPASMAVVQQVLPDTAPALLDELDGAAMQGHAAAYIDVAKVREHARSGAKSALDWIPLERALSCLQIASLQRQSASTLSTQEELYAADGTQPYG